MKKYLKTLVIGEVLFLGCLLSCDILNFNSTNYDDKVLNDLLRLDTIDTPTHIYKFKTILTAGDTLTVIADIYETQDTLYINHNVFTPSHETWFYFIDYYSGYFFAHPVECIFIDTKTDQVDRFMGEWWPVLNNEDLFFNQDQINKQAILLRNITPSFDINIVDTFDWDFYGLDEDASIKSDKFKLFHNSFFYDKTTDAGDVLIVNGIDPSDKAREASEQAVELAENGFKKGGYKQPPTIIDVKDQKPGDPNDATERKLLNFLSKYDAPSGRNLTVYIVAHGKTSGFRMGKNQGSSYNFVKISELKKSLESLLEKGIRVKIISQACYSGKVFEKLKGYIAVGIAAANNTPAVAEDVDLHDTNPEDTGPEFTSGYFEDYCKIHDRLNTIPELKEWFIKFAEETNMPVEELILYAAFTTAVEKDATAKKSYSGKKSVPKRYPIKYDDKRLNENLEESEGLTKKVPDWIEILIGRLPVPI